MFLIEKNSILMRIENLADLFDSEKIEFQTVDVEQLAKGLYTLVNGLGTEFSVEVTEMSLTATMEIEEMTGRKLHWRVLPQHDQEFTRGVEDTN